MHLRAHRFFAMVVTTGSFSAAARHFQVPASSVSRFIASLEQELGQQLLYRNSRSVKLTDAGERYYTQIRSVLELLDAADEEIGGDAGNIRGVVKINAPAVFGRLHFSRTIVDLRAAYPDLIVELTLTDDFVDPVREGADIIFRIGRVEDSELIGRKICDQRFVLCASPDYLDRLGAPDSPEALRLHQCLVHKGNGGVERWHFRPALGEPISIDVTGHLRCNNSEVLLQSALAGQGIALLPSWLLNRQYFDERALVRLFPDCDVGMHPVTSQMYLISPENRLRSKKVRAVWNFLLDAIGEPPYWD